MKSNKNFNQVNIITAKGNDGSSLAQKKGGEEKNPPAHPCTSACPCVHSHPCVCAPPRTYMVPCTCTHVCVYARFVYLIGKSLAPSRPQFYHLYNGALITGLRSLSAGKLCNLVPAHSCAHGHITWWRWQPCPTRLTDAISEHRDLSPAPGPLLTFVGSGAMVQMEGHIPCV